MTFLSQNMLRNNLHGVSLIILQMRLINDRSYPTICSKVFMFVYFLSHWYCLRNILPDFKRKLGSRGNKKLLWWYTKCNFKANFLRKDEYTRCFKRVHDFQWNFVQTSLKVSLAKQNWSAQTIFINTKEKCSDLNYPLTPIDFRILAIATLDKQSRSAVKFPNNLPGPDWVNPLLKRHND